MSEWLCVLLHATCKWIHIVNISESIGLWQCQRCKIVSKGRAIYQTKEKKE